MDVYLQKFADEAANLVGIGLHEALGPNVPLIEYSVMGQKIRMVARIYKYRGFGDVKITAAA